jgi:hypothetical protein
MKLGIWPASSTSESADWGRLHEFRGRSVRMRDGRDRQHSFRLAAAVRGVPIGEDVPTTDGNDGELFLRWRSMRASARLLMAGAFHFRKQKVEVR